MKLFLIVFFGLVVSCSAQMSIVNTTNTTCSLYSNTGEIVMDLDPSLIGGVGVSVEDTTTTTTTDINGILLNNTISVKSVVNIPNVTTGVYYIVEDDVYNALGVRLDVFRKNSRIFIGKFKGYVAEKLP